MFIADLHIHSKYSRATSKECVPEHLDLWARRKGLGLIGTGDFTHPAWRRELGEKLTPTGEGTYILKEELRLPDPVAGVHPPTRFVVTGEISSIYKKNGRVRKVHSLILLPGLEEAEALSRRLEAIGNLHSDGRPILGLDSRDLLEITLESCPEAIFIPAHIWTPHFSLFGAYSSFDTIEECFGDLTGHIHALETGLSSNPPMNWRLSALDRFALVSNSDAHSPANLAREANLFDTAPTYHHIAKALRERDQKAFRGTIEFYPEEGKYHFNGHRNCGVCQSPSETAASGGICPVCGRKVTVGVFQRVEELADREEGHVPPRAARFESLVPLPEVIAASTGYSPKSIKGRGLYSALLRELGPELFLLREAAVEDIEVIAGPATAEGVRRLRQGEVAVSPGFDGAYGKVSILEPHEIQQLSGQLGLFVPEPRKTATPRTKAASKPKVGKAPPAKRTRSPRQRNALRELNPEQRAAAFSTAPVTAVIAGPGTGKTKTLVARIAHLVQEQGVAPGDITAVTFTNKAAREMRERLEGHFGGSQLVSAMAIGTFHSICLTQLSGDGREPAIIDDTAAKAILGDVIRELGLTLPVGDALRAISLDKCGAAPTGSDAAPPELAEAYRRRLADWGVLDYDDILLAALEREEGQGNRFAHLLVDEFQDVNPVQYQLIRKWSQRGQSLFVIGDPDQAIYAFRGSDPRCFQWLRRDYAGLTKTRLCRNYRSSPEILEAALPVVNRTGGPDRELRAERARGARVRMVQGDNAFQEALSVVKEIGRMVGGMDMLDSAGHPLLTQVRGFSDIGVLYRTNRQAAVLEECLAQEGIPYVVAGREDFHSHPESLKMLAFFRLLLHPEDLASLWIGMKELAGCDSKLMRDIVNRYGEAEKNIPRLLQILAACTGALGQFAALLEEFIAALSGSAPQKLIGLWIERTKPDPGWADKVAHMAVFYDTIEDFLRATALGQESDLRRYGGKGYAGDAVSLMTLHGSKGLEFPVVFLCGVAEGLIPYHAHGTGASEAEERRLLYVGMTRAKEELILLHAGTPSPFLADLPGHLLDVKTAYRPKEPQYRQFSLFE